MVHMTMDVWLRMDVDPSFTLLAEMSERRCYYNGQRYIRAEDAGAADELISFLRKAGHEVERKQPPEQRGFDGWTKFAVSRAIDFPKRIFI